MRRFAFSLVIMAVALLAPAAFGDPSPTYSSVPPWLNVVTPHPWGLEPADVYTVVVRDEVGDPVPGVQVVLDFGACNHIRFAAEQVTPSDVVVDCASDTMRALTNASGTATFVVYGSVVSRVPTVSDVGCVTVYAGFPRVELGHSSVRSYDLDGFNGLTANDLSLFLCDLGIGQYVARCDYNGTGGVNALDLTLWLTKYMNARGNGRTATRCDGVPSTTPRVMAPAGSLRLAWNACAGDGGEQTRTFACNTNAQYEYLVASFIAPPGVESLTGFDAELWVVGDAGAPIPNWWRLEAGGCRFQQASVDVSYEICPGPVSDPSGWTILQAAEYSGGLDAPNVVVLRVTGAISQPAPQLEAGQEYGLFTLKLSHARTIGQCAGCAEPVALMLDWVYLRQSGGGCALPDPDSPYPDFLLRQGGGSIAYWQGVPQGGIPIAVGEPPVLPPALRLSSESPARGRANVTLGVPRPMHCRLALYDVAGRSHRVLLDDTIPAGVRTLHWDGRGDSGELLPSGYYILRLVGGNETVSRSLVWLR